MRRIGLCAFTTVLMIAALAAMARAQTTTGGITGVVRDAGGGVMPGVTVTATHDATNAETTTVSNDVGLYVLRGLPVGRYTVVAELPGFQTAKNTDIVVRVNEDVRLDIGLEGRGGHRHGHRQRHGVDRGHHHRNAQDRRRSGAHREACRSTAATPPS